MKSVTFFERARELVAQMTLDEKISQMKKSLLEGNLSMKEISDGLGFSSVYYFCKFFTSHAGVSPGVYRKTEKESKQ